MNRRGLSVASVGVVALLLGGCGAGSGASGPAGPGEPSSAAAQTLTVFAAASLRAPFATLGRTFEASHPGTTVRFSFAGSSDLVAQLQQGAPADVLATADTVTMGRAVDDGLVASAPVPVATNTLEIAVPPGNPARITSFADLARPGVAVVVCAPQVPCGAAARKVEAVTGTTLSPASEENAVTDVLGKVTSGEADAGLVYVTDVRAAGRQVTGIPFPESKEAVTTYPVATLRSATDAGLAEGFVRLVASADGRRVLADAGFAAP